MCDNYERTTRSLCTNSVRLKSFLDFRRCFSHLARDLSLACHCLEPDALVGYHRWVAQSSSCLEPAETTWSRDTPRVTPRVTSRITSRGTSRVTPSVATRHKTYDREDNVIWIILYKWLTEHDKTTIIWVHLNGWTIYLNLNPSVD